jgi:hypothetical protein
MDQWAETVYENSIYAHENQVLDNRLRLCCSGHGVMTCTNTLETVLEVQMRRKRAKMNPG